MLETITLGRSKILLTVAHKKVLPSLCIDPMIDRRPRFLDWIKRHLILL